MRFDGAVYDELVEQIDAELQKLAQISPGLQSTRERSEYSGDCGEAIVGSKLIRRL
jgi:hypothetical protein